MGLVGEGHGGSVFELSGGIEDVIFGAERTEKCGNGGVWFGGGFGVVCWCWGPLGKWSQGYLML